MNFEREKAMLLAENLIYFVEFVYNCHQHNQHLCDPDKLYRLKHLVDEYRLQLLGKELKRLNIFEWEEKQSIILIERVKNSITSISEYIENNIEGLFIFSARMYFLTEISTSFKRI